MDSGLGMGRVVGPIEVNLAPLQKRLEDSQVLPQVSQRCLELRADQSLPASPVAGTDPQTETARRQLRHDPRLLGRRHGMPGHVGIMEVPRRIRSVLAAVAAKTVIPSRPAPPVVIQAACIPRASACWIRSRTSLVSCPVMATPIFLSLLAMSCLPKRLVRPCSDKSGLSPLRRGEGITGCVHLVPNPSLAVPFATGSGIRYG